MILKRMGKEEHKMEEWKDGRMEEKQSKMASAGGGQESKIKKGTADGRGWKNKNGRIKMERWKTEK